MTPTQQAKKPAAGFRTMFWCALTPVLLAMLVAYPASLYLGAPVGGISRRGAWPERDYIWQQEPPAIALLDNHAALQDPDVVVIGDSFSLPNAWQSVVGNATGLRIKTYNNLNNHNCFLPWIERIADGLEGRAQAGNKLIIIESIEHQFMERFREPERCAQNSTFQVRPVVAGSLTWSRTSVHTQIDLARQFQTLWHMWQVYAYPTRNAGEWVINAPLKRADLFSNHKSDRLLYIDLDEQRLRWTAADMGQAAQVIKKTQDRLEAAGFQFQMLIIPDKLHAYEDELLTPLVAHPASDLARTLRQAGVHAPDVLTPLKRAIYQSKDLYMPNDDHLGTSGQTVLGRALIDAGAFNGLKAQTR